MRTGCMVACLLKKDLKKKQKNNKTIVAKILVYLHHCVSVYGQHSYGRYNCRKLLTFNQGSILSEDGDTPNTAAKYNS